MNLPRIYLACESVRAGNGGICRVARLMARVLSEEQAMGRCLVGGVVLSDQEPAPELGVEFRLVRGSRAKFVTTVNAAHLTYTHFIYDCAGMARAHQWIPLPRRPYLTFLHGIEVWQGTAHPAQLRTACRSNVLLSNTSFTRTKATELTPSFARASVCWLATEEDSPPAYTQSLASRPRVLILSRLDEAAYKGHTELIRCWQTVRASVPNAVLTIAGTGLAASRYQHLAAELGLPSESVEFRGFVPETEMSRLWTETTVFAMPSKGEGFGLVYIEAMRHGIPVVASVHDAGPEVNLDGVTGFNVDLDQPNELPDRLIRLLREPELASRMGGNGVARWAEHFRYSAFQDRFTRILREWIGE